MGSIGTLDDFEDLPLAITEKIGDLASVKEQQSSAPLGHEPIPAVADPVGCRLASLAIRAMDAYRGL